jgi:hypothetical protein
MAKITQIHLWMHDKTDTWREPEVINPRTGKPQKGKRIVLEPESDSLTGMKIQIAREIRKWTNTGKLKNYYVVIVVEKSDGEFAYRTVIPTTVVA